MSNRPPTRMGRTKEKLSQIKDLAGEYAEDSNVAGLKQIFQASTLVARGIWSLLFIICLVGFVYQVYDRVLYFITWPVSVNIEVTINETVIFPAITFCNTNSFRITRAEKTGLFNNLTAFYERGITNGSGPVLLYPSMFKMMGKLAHSKWDMIYSCRWLDTKCSAENFTEMITDYGLCYSFNLVEDPKARLNVSGTGSKYGLELVLNIEQYEYMAGPHDSAGVRVLVHDQHEIPRVKDLASSVPSSMNAFLGIQVTKVHNLPPPFGPCAKKELEHQQFYSQSLCQDICIGKKVAEICGCRAPHMNWRDGNGTNKVPVCSVMGYYSCVKPLIDQSGRWRNCTNIHTCPIKCLQTAYTAHVSYTASSDAELHKKVKVLKRNTNLLQNFVRAQVARHRIVPEYYLEDQAAIGTLFNRSRQVMRQFGQSSSQSLVRKGIHRLNYTLNAGLLPKAYADLGTLSKALEILRNNYTDRLNTEALNYYLHAMSFNVKSRSIVRYTNMTTIDLFHQIKLYGQIRNGSRRSAGGTQKQNGPEGHPSPHPRQDNAMATPEIVSGRHRARRSVDTTTLDFGSGLSRPRRIADTTLDKVSRPHRPRRNADTTLEIGSGLGPRRVPPALPQRMISKKTRGKQRNIGSRRPRPRRIANTIQDMGSGRPRPGMSADTTLDKGKGLPRPRRNADTTLELGSRFGPRRVPPTPPQWLIPKKIRGVQRNLGSVGGGNGGYGFGGGGGWLRGPGGMGGGIDDFAIDESEISTYAKLARSHKSKGFDFGRGKRSNRPMSPRRVRIKLMVLARAFSEYKLPLIMVEEIIRDAITLYKINKDTNLAILRNSEFSGLPLEQMRKKANEVLVELEKFLTVVSSFQDNITEFEELINNATGRFWNQDKTIVMPKLSRVQKLLGYIGDLLPKLRGREATRILKSVCDDLNLGIRQVMDTKSVLDRYAVIIAQGLGTLEQDIANGRYHFKDLYRTAETFYRSLSNWAKFSKENLFFLLDSNQTMAFDVFRKYGTATLDGLKSIKDELIDFEKDALSKINTLKQSKLNSMTYASKSSGLLLQLEDRMNDLTTAIKAVEKLIALYEEIFGGFSAAFLDLRRRGQEFKDSLLINDHFVRRNFMKVNVFYQRLSYQEITKQEAYQWFALACDIGGSAGLLLGASLLTVAELVYFIINQCQASKPKNDQVDSIDPVMPVSYHPEPELKKKQDKWDAVMNAW